MKKIFYFLILLFSFIFVSPAFAVLEISDGSVLSLYHLEDVVDSSGNGHNATNVNSSTFTTGKLSNAISFNGSSQYLSLPNSAFPWADSSFEVCYWLKYGSTSGSMSSLMNDDSGSNGLYIYYDSGNTRERFVEKSGGGTNYTYTRDTNWHLWCNSATGTDYKIYLDNVEVASSSDATGIVNPGNYPIFLGAYNVAGTPQANFYLNGLVDELVILNRPFTGTERTDFYNAGIAQEICTTVGCASTSSPATSSSVGGFSIPSSQGIALATFGGVLCLIAMNLLKP